MLQTDNQEVELIKIFDEANASLEEIPLIEFNELIVQKPIEFEAGKIPFQQPNQTPPIQPPTMEEQQKQVEENNKKVIEKQHHPNFNYKKETTVQQPQPQKTAEELAEEKKWADEDAKRIPKMPEFKWYNWLILLFIVGTLIWYFFLR